MRRYSPPAGPLWRRIYRNPLHLIPIVLAVVLGTSVFIYRHNQNTLNREMIETHLLESTPILPPDETPQTPDSRSVSEQRDLPSQPPTPRETPAATGAMKETNRAEPAGDSSPEKNLENHLLFRQDEPLKVQLRFFEASRNFLTQAMAKAQTLNEAQDYAMALLPQANKSLEDALKTRELAVLEKGEADMVLNSAPYLLTSPGSGSQGQKILGITTLATLTEFNEHLAILQLEVQRRLKENESDPLQQLMIYEQVSVSPGSAIIFVGLLPRRKASESEARVAPGSSLEIMRSMAFLNQESDLLMVIEPKATLLQRGP